MPETPPAKAPRPRARGRLFLLSGPSASGKDSVRDLLMAWGLSLHFAVTATDRRPREGEVDGVHYHFMETEAFERLEREGGLIEHAIVYEQHKGVPRSEVEVPLANGQDVLARVDIQGAATLKRLYPDAVVIFIAPPSLAEASRRLGDRDSETPEQVRLRRETAIAEMKAAEGADYRVVNTTGQLEATARRIAEIIEEERRRRPPSPTT